MRMSKLPLIQELGPQHPSLEKAAEEHQDTTKVDEVIKAARHDCKSCKLRNGGFMGLPPCPDTDGEKPIVDECEADVW